MVPSDTSRGLPRHCLSVSSITRSFPEMDISTALAFSISVRILKYRRCARKSERPQGACRDEQGGEKERREHVRHPDLLQVEQPQAESSTPPPSTEAKAIAAIKSRALLRARRL